MASHASAVKAHRQSLLRRERNRRLRAELRHALKDARTALDSGAPTAGDVVRKTAALIDRMASKGIIHANAAGRYKSRLVKRAKAKSAA